MYKISRKSKYIMRVIQEIRCQTTSIAYYDILQSLDVKFLHEDIFRCIIEGQTFVKFLVKHIKCEK